MCAAQLLDKPRSRQGSAGTCDRCAWHFGLRRLHITGNLTCPESKFGGFQKLSSQGGDVIWQAEALVPRCGWVLLLVAAWLPWVAARAGDIDSELELLALDERAGRAVFMDVAGATSVLLLDEENQDGVRLRSVVDGSALIEVRFKDSGEVIAYRIRLGERVHIRPPQQHRSGGVSVIAVSPEVRTGVKAPSSPAKD